MLTAERLSIPDSTTSTRYEKLAYHEAYDAVLNIDYAFLAYKEIETPNGPWRVRIRSSQTAGGVFEPELIRNQSRLATNQGKPYFTWGYSFDPTDSDPRTISFRVHVENNQPTAIEIYTRLRKADGTAGEASSVRFAWPA